MIAEGSILGVPGALGKALNNTSSQCQTTRIPPKKKNSIMERSSSQLGPTLGFAVQEPWKKINMSIGPCQGIRHPTPHPIRVRPSLSPFLIRRLTRKTDTDAIWLVWTPVEAPGSGGLRCPRPVVSVFSVRTGPTGPGEREAAAECGDVSTAASISRRLPRSSDGR